MTFYEAAIQILLQAGQPLHASEIAQRAIQENLLSHVGKDPEGTMASRLAAMARRSQDRRLVAVEPDIFGLTDWNLKNSPEALEQSGLPEVHDEDAPSLRSRERHPKIDKENVRVAGRSDRRRRHEEVDRKRKRRLGPVPEFVFELLGRIGIPVPLFELAAAVREKDLVADDLGREALGAMLAAENERREGEGRRPLFALYDEGLAGLQGGAAPSDEEQDYPALVAKAVRRLSEDRRPSQPQAAAAGPAPSGAVERAVADQRQRAIRQLRRRLIELDAAGLEAIAASMLESMGYRDLRVAKRHKDGALFTTRRRMGLTEVRFAVRVIRGGREVRREEIAELRKDMGSHSAQLGVIVSPSDVTREAKNEASQASLPLVTLLCADALADQLAERGVGVVTRTVSYVDYDDGAFRSLLRRAPTEAGAGDAEGGGSRRSESAAEERRERRERERKEWRERREQAREERRRQRAEAEAAQKAQAGEAGAGGAAGGDVGSSGDERARPGRGKAENEDATEADESGRRSQAAQAGSDAAKTAEAGDEAGRDVASETAGEAGVEVPASTHEAAREDASKARRKAAAKIDDAGRDASEASDEAGRTQPPVKGGDAGRTSEPSGAPPKDIAEAARGGGSAGAGTDAAEATAPAARSKSRAASARDEAAAIDRELDAPSSRAADEQEQRGSGEAFASTSTHENQEATVEAAASEDTAIAAERARASEQPSSGDES